MRQCPPIVIKGTSKKNYKKSREKKFARSVGEFDIFNLVKKIFEKEKEKEGKKTKFDEDES